jgi:predicted DNA-binding protein
MKKDLIVRVPISMFDELTQLAKLEDKPRSYLVREFLQKGIEQRRIKNDIKALVEGIK